MDGGTDKGVYKIDIIVYTIDPDYTKFHTLEEQIIITNTV